MRCNDYFVWMSGHLDGTNSEREEQSLQKHLASCPQCRQAMEDMKVNDAVLQSEPLTPPERIVKNVMASVRKDAKKRSNRIRSYIVSVAAAAAVLCLVLVASLRTPERPDTESSARSVDTPTEEICENVEEETTHTPAHAPEAAEAYTGGAVAAEDRSTRDIVAHTDSPYHCVFVELPSQDMVPENLPPLAVEDFYFRITKEAQDMYYYGGSMIYGATLMTYEEMMQWNSQIQFRFIHDGVESDTYVVVFCSESR